jgi:hypothetical protein
MTETELDELKGIMIASDAYWDINPVGSGAVLDSLITYCLHQNDLVFELSLKSIAGLAGVCLDTARASVSRLKRKGFLELLDENAGPHLRQYRLTKPGNLTR